MDSLLKGNVIPTAEAGEPEECGQIPQDGLIASYLFQGTAEDETGTYNGTETNITYLYDDERGVVADFNGTSSQMLIGTGSDFNFLVGDSFTISTWFKADSQVSNYLISRANPTFATRSWSVYYATGIITIYSAAGRTFSYTLPTGTLVKLDIVFHTSTISLYVNGNFEQTVSKPSWRVTSSASTIIGTLDGANRHDGTLSNFHIYDRAITAQEVTDIYNLEKYHHNNTLAHGLVAYYPLDGNSLDNAINQEDGTDTSMTYPTDTDMGVVADFNGTNGRVALTQIDYVSFSVHILMTESNSRFYYTNYLMGFLQVIDGNFAMYTYANKNGASSGLIHDMTKAITFTEDTWYHIYVEINSQSDPTQNKVFINGVEETGFSTGSTDPNSFYGSTGLGSNTYQGSTSYYTSRGSKLRLYDRPLSEKEIEWLYDFEKPNSTECPHNFTINNPDPFEDGSGIALYKVDGNVNDTTGDYDGTPSNITYIEGVFGQMAKASAGVIDTGSLTLLPHDSNYSFSCYYKHESAQRVALINRMNTATTYGDNHVLYPSGAFKFQLATGSTSLETYDTPVYSWNIGQTYHIVITHDRTAKTVKYYIDDVLFYTHNVTAGNSYDSAHTTKFFGYTNVEYSGAFDQIRVFNKAISAEEVTILTNERKV